MWVYRVQTEWEFKIFGDTGRCCVRTGSEYVIDPATLRRHSKDALSVDEITGKQLLDPASVSDDIKPLNIEKRGNYGVAIAWDDGHQVRLFCYTAC